MVHGESEVLAGSLKISRPLINVVAGHKRSERWRGK